MQPCFVKNKMDQYISAVQRSHAIGDFNSEVPFRASLYWTTIWARPATTKTLKKRGKRVPNI